MKNTFIIYLIIKYLQLDKIRNGKYENSDVYLKNDIKDFNKNSTVINNKLYNKERDDLIRSDLLKKIDSLTYNKK